MADRNDKTSQWLAGSQRVSKKVFSFKAPERTFGFIKPALIDFKEMERRLMDVWEQDGWNFITGDALLGQLFPKGEKQA